MTYCTIQYYTILYHTILYYILYTIYYILYTINYILYSIYYTVLYYTILYYTILACHFHKHATSLQAKGPSYGRDFARHCEVSLRAPQAQKWHARESRAFGRQLVV